ncbi:hypothetical protein BKA80DRAFT_49801 [Phyllosticta citrichinensis]
MLYLTFPAILGPMTAPQFRKTWTLLLAKCLTMPLFAPKTLAAKMPPGLWMPAPRESWRGTFGSLENRGRGEGRELQPENSRQSRHMYTCMQQKQEAGTNQRLTEAEPPRSASLSNALTRATRTPPRHSSKNNDGRQGVDKMRGCRWRRGAPHASQQASQPLPPRLVPPGETSSSWLSLATHAQLVADQLTHRASASCVGAYGVGCTVLMMEAWGSHRASTAPWCGVPDGAASDVFLCRLIRRTVLVFCTLLG